MTKNLRLYKNRKKFAVIVFFLTFANAVLKIMCFMKYLFTILFAFIALGVNAQTKYIVFHQNGTETTSRQSFSNAPKLTRVDGKWALANGEGEETFDSIGKITFRNILKGDANTDEHVDVADITSTASFILGRNPENFVKENGDSNGDGSIDVADLTSTAGIILQK